LLILYTILPQSHHISTSHHHPRWCVCVCMCVCVCVCVCVTVCVCVCVGVFVWPVAVDITKIISDREGIPRLFRGILFGTIIQCFPLVRVFLYPPPEDARGCQCVPAHCPRPHGGDEKFSSILLIPTNWLSAKPKPQSPQVWIRPLVY